MSNSNQTQGAAADPENTPPSRSIDATLMQLAAQLRAASSLEAAAAVVLRRMLEVARAALEASPFAGSGQIVRAVLHVRPDDGYRALIALEEGAHEVDSAAARSLLAPCQGRLPSVTAWPWLVEHRSAVAIDVNLGRVQPGHSELAAGHADRVFSGLDGSDPQSRVRPIERDVTHLYLLPLRGTGDRVEGIVSIEADCRKAIGQPFVWHQCAELFELLVDCAAPHLVSLPSVAVHASSVDPFLPVLGTKTAATAQLLRAFALQTEPILISGPPGAGKAHLARFSHEHSGGQSGPFEVLDLASLPEELQLPELLGWKQGAFPDALNDQPGLIERASGGTLFISGVDSLCARAQAGLLRILEERTYRPLGDSGKGRPVDARFIFGTTASLYDLVRAKRFRADLYCRISALAVKLLPLSDRSDEIMSWARWMATRLHAKRVPEGSVLFAAAAEAILLNQGWPGNLRQLHNVVARAYLRAANAHDAVPRELLLDDEHIRAALADPGRQEPEPLIEALLTAAGAFIRAAEKCFADGNPIDLDLTDGFKGFVLAAATQKLGSREQAFRLFGRAKLVSSRNHQKVFRRELDRALKLCNSLARHAEFPFKAYVGPEEAISSNGPNE